MNNDTQKMKNINKNKKRKNEVQKMKNINKNKKCRKADQAACNEKILDPQIYLGQGQSKKWPHGGSSQSVA